MLSTQSCLKHFFLKQGAFPPKDLYVFSQNRIFLNSNGVKRFTLSVLRREGWGSHIAPPFTVTLLLAGHRQVTCLHTHT